jgi:hypothetical protein
MELKSSGCDHISILSNQLLEVRGPLVRKIISCWTLLHMCGCSNPYVFFLNKKKIQSHTSDLFMESISDRVNQIFRLVDSIISLGGKMLASTSMDHHRSVWWRAETTTTISTETDPHRLGTNKGTKHTRSSTATWTTRTTGADAPRQQAQPFWQVGRVHAFGRLGLCRAHAVDASFLNASNAVALAGTLVVVGRRRWKPCPSCSQG